MAVGKPTHGIQEKRPNRGALNICLTSPLAMCQLLYLCLFFCPKILWFKKIVISLRQ